MAKEIIQHHEPIDFEKFYGTVKAGYINIDYQDFDNFMNHPGEKHSFIGIADEKDGLIGALEGAIAYYEIADLKNRTSSLLITVVRSPEASRPLRMDEIQYIGEFVKELPKDCDVVWGIADDPSLGNEVKIIFLVTVKD